MANRSQGFTERIDIKVVFNQTRLKADAVAKTHQRQCLRAGYS
jgi:hypothetical protein